MTRLIVVLVLALAAATAARADSDKSAAPAAGDDSAASGTRLTMVKGAVSAAVERTWVPVVRGLGTAETLIGDAYYYGHMVPRDYATATGWYRLAAGKGNPLAESTLGDIYYYGRGVPQDYVEAVKWWRLAAAQGIAVAQLNLGVMYANGDGVKQDYVQAHFYTNLAAAKLPPGKDRDIAVKNRAIVARLMTPAQIAEAQRMARDWRPQ